MAVTSPVLPLGADTPDELIVAYVNGSLSAEQRRAVERWLSEHPEYRVRVTSLRAVRTAVRTAPPGVDARPPAASELDGLWRAIDSSPRAAAPPEVPASPIPLDTVRRRATARWLLAAAAAVLVLAGVVTVVAQRGGDEELETATAPADASEQPAVMLAALTGSADATAAARTANVSLEARTESGVAGGPPTIELAGTGQVELPGRAMLDTRTTTRAPSGEPQGPTVAGRVVEDGGRTYVRCRGESHYTERAPAEADCVGLAVDVVGPNATIAMIGSVAADDVTAMGRAIFDGIAMTGYQVTRPVEFDGQQIALVTQIWIDADSLIRRIVGTAAAAGQQGRLVVAYVLTDFGVTVDIPHLD